MAGSPPGLTACFSCFCQVRLHFPKEGLVFDYRLDDAGISSIEDDEDDDNEGKKVTMGLPRNEGG